MHFKQRASEKLNDTQLRRALDQARGKFVDKRALSLSDFDDFEATREHARQIRDRVIGDLDFYLEKFEQEATARGAQVHWAETAADVNRIVCEIAARHSVRKAVKSKSMITEECGLNKAMEAAGLEVIETDLGEYILQLADEPPSHIVAPVVHKPKDEVSDLFEEKHKRPRKTGIPELCREAREMLRPHFLSADMGITGANFVIAETGSTLIVTNEGNGRLVTTLPRVHVAITGIEKVVPTLEDVSTLLRLLTRSATGQPITNYVSVTTGPKQKHDHDGPEHFHIVLVDAGRSRLLHTEFAPMLRCIRCGACMNHCPVYQNIGGHAYGWVYPGPMGSVLTPLYAGIENALDLPYASTFCKHCEVVCPVKIPLPDLMRSLRERQIEQKLRPWSERAGLKVWGWLALKPTLYAMTAKLVTRSLKLLGGRDKQIHRLPFGSGWTAGRDFPAPEGKTFRELYKPRAASEELRQ
jgi:L-lactate dehydrogenase complex protein LldF